MGFNGARKHQKVETCIGPTGWAFSFQAEIANAYEFDEQYVQRIGHGAWPQLQSPVKIHRLNVINESWGVPNLTARSPGRLRTCSLPGEKIRRGW